MRQELFRMELYVLTATACALNATEHRMLIVSAATLLIIDTWCKINVHACLSTMRPKIRWSASRGVAMALL